MSAAPIGAITPTETAIPVCAKSACPFPATGIGNLHLGPKSRSNTRGNGHVAFPVVGDRSSASIAVRASFIPRTRPARKIVCCSGVSRRASSESSLGSLSSWRSPQHVQYQLSSTFEYPCTVVPIKCFPPLPPEPQVPLHRGQIPSHFPCRFTMSPFPC